MRFQHTAPTLVAISMATALTLSANAQDAPAKLLQPGTDSTEYAPRYRQPVGSQIVVVYVGMTGCGASRDPELKAAVYSMKPLLARQAEALARPLSIVGVSLDWVPDSGFVYLSGLGRWDEMVLGNNWVNLGAERHIWRDPAGRASIPQIIVLERAITLGNRIVFGDDRTMARIIGTDDIINWVHDGATLPVSAAPSVLQHPPAN